MNVTFRCEKSLILRPDKTTGLRAGRRCFIFGVEEIDKRYSAEQYGYLLSLTHSRSEAEDLPSEVFVRVLTGFSSFRGESSVRTWLYAIARNVWLEQLRKRRRAAGLAERLYLYAQSSDFGDQMGGAAGEIMACVNRLDEPAKSIVLMRREGYRYEEIAARLGVRTASARVMEHRARKKLRELLKEEGLIDE